MLAVATLAFIGSLQAALSAVLAIPMSRVVSAFGPRTVASIGAILFGLASILAGSLTQNVVGLILIEVSSSLLFECSKLTFFRE